MEVPCSDMDLACRSNGRTHTLQVLIGRARTRKRGPWRPKPLWLQVMLDIRPVEES
jgi:hypothetical protein